MNEHDVFICKILKVKISLDLYENFDYVAKLKDPIELRYIASGDYYASTKEIESIVDAVSNKIRDYLSSNLNERGTI